MEAFRTVLCDVSLSKCRTSCCTRQRNACWRSNNSIRLFDELESGQQRRWFPLPHYRNEPRVDAVHELLLSQQPRFYRLMTGKQQWNQWMELTAHDYHVWNGWTLMDGPVEWIDLV
ncbi:hypothetical protein PRIPAC_70165 [Pristionchus pacificus]|uniref:Uncharacterized protein n=1 Tax=Pristionchus pacificus TaxID=54126 RepID=A0A2A6CGD5_PRIPA|nr:hypothetical protein PRIPAC_70165 [Pristionchus pacificus]|eukprot:PDM77081.1 hypothetical protein PRIPAC_42476 [Pristionchus pacificus]